jgi:hypothetical protein
MSTARLELFRRRRSPWPGPPWLSSHLLKDPAARFTDLDYGYYQMSDTASER